MGARRLLVWLLGIQVLVLLCPYRLPAQGWVWAKYANSVQTDGGYGIAADKATGEVYMAGLTGGILNEFGLSGANTSDGWVAKIKPNGSLVWAFLFGAAGQQSVTDIAVDTVMHRFYIVGNYTGQLTIQGRSGPNFSNASSVGQDIFVAAFDSAGVLLWATTESGTSNQFANGIGLDGSSVYITGSYNGTTTFDGTTGVPTVSLPVTGTEDWFLARYDIGTGALAWAQHNIGGTNRHRGNCVVTDANRIYFCGAYSGASSQVQGTSGVTTLTNSNAGNFDLFVMGIRKTDGFAQWVISGGANGGDDEAIGVDVDANGLYICGYAANNANFPPLGNFPTGSGQDAFVSRHDPATGAAQWVNIMGNAVAASTEGARGIDIDKLGNVYVSGLFSNSLNLPKNSATTKTLVSTGMADLFLASFTPAGALIAGESAGSAGSNEVASEVTAVDDQNIYTIGIYAGAACTFPTSPLSTSLPMDGLEDILFAKFGTCYINFNPSNPITASSNSICDGETVTLNIGSTQSGWNYQIVDNNSGSPIGPMVIGTGGPMSFTTPPLNQDTTLAIEVYANNPACTVRFTTTQFIDVHPNPIVNLGADTSICSAFPLTLDAGAGFASYLWNGGLTTRTRVVSTTGTYSVTVTDVNGCQGNDAIDVTVLPSPGLNIGANRTICPGDSTLLDAFPGFIAYAWSTGATSQSIWVKSVGQNYVTVTSLNGCTTTDSLFVSWHPQPVVNIGPDVAQCVGSTLPLTAGPGFSTYAWSTGATTMGIVATSAGQYRVTVTNAQGCKDADTMQFTLNPLPTPNLGVDRAICSGNSTILDAGPGYTSYVWTGGFTTQTISVSTAGTYSVTVTDGNGCQGNDAINITVNPLPTPNLGPDVAVCSGNSTVLNAGAGYTSYVWTGGFTTQTISVSTAGTYSVTVTDGNGCQGIDAINVTVNGMPSPNLGQDRGICSGNSTVLDAGPGYTNYLWTGGFTTQTITVSTAGTYSVTVTDGSGCQGNDAVTITVNPLPTPNLGPNATICDGNSTVLDAGPGYSAYVWTGSFTTQTISVSTAGTYSVTVTDGNGCQGNDAMTLTVNPSPSPNLGNDTTICAGDSVTLDAGIGFANYQWSNGATTQTITVNATNQYRVTVSDGIGCQGSDTLNLTLIPLPVVQLGNDTAICLGDTLLLDAGSGQLSYLWNGGSTTQTLPADTAGIYGVVVTGVSGCISSDSLTLSILVAPSFSLGPDISVCSTIAAPLGAPSGFAAYLWNTFQTTDSILANNPGTYSVTVTDGLGCTGIDSIDLIWFPLPNPQLYPDTSICMGDSILLDAGSGYTTYAWTNGDTTQTTYVSLAGAHGVMVTDSNGCSDSATMLLSNYALPTVSIGPNTAICDGDTLPLNAGNPGGTYLWSNGSTNQIILATVADTFWVHVQDSNSCNGADSMILTLLASPIPSLGNDTSICTGDSITLDAGNPGATYTWDNGSTSQTIVVQAARTYIVTVTGPNGCSIIDDLDLSLYALPVVVLGIDDTICENTSITLDAGNPGADYVWSTGDSTAVIQVSLPAQYSVIVTTAQGCIGRDTLNLFTSPLPQPSLGPDQAFCLGNGIDLQSSSSLYIILWSDSSNGPTLYVDVPGTYWLSWEDSLGCIGRDSINVSMQLPPTVSFATLDPLYCLTDPGVALVGSPAGGSFAGDASTTGFFEPAVAGTGSAVVTYLFMDTLGCVGVDTQATEVVPPPSLAEAGTARVGGTEVQLHADLPAIGIPHWESPTGVGTFADPSDPNTIVTLSTDGLHPMVWVVENPPCDPTRDTVWVTGENLHIPDGFSPNADNLNDYFVIRGLESYDQVRLLIFNRWGNQVWASENYRNEWSGDNAQHQPLVDDTYYYVLEYGGKKASSFVVIKR